MVIARCRFPGRTEVVRWFDDGVTQRCPKAKPHFRLKLRTQEFVARYSWKAYGYELISEGGSIRARLIE